MILALAILLRSFDLLSCLNFDLVEELGMEKQFLSSRAMVAILLGTCAWGGFNGLESLNVHFFWQGFAILLPLQICASTGVAFYLWKKAH